MATDYDLYKVSRTLNVCIDFELLKVKVSVIFLGTVGFLACRDERSLYCQTDHVVLIKGKWPRVK